MPEELVSSVNLRSLITQLRNQRGFVDPTVLAKSLTIAQDGYDLLDKRLRNLASNTLGLLPVSSVDLSKLTGDLRDLRVRGTLTADYILAASIDATKLNIKDIIAVGLAFANNSPGAGSVAWGGFTIYWNGIAYPITAGNSASAILYWNAGDATLTGTTVAAYTPQTNRFVIGTNVSGTATESWNTLGSQVVTTKMLADGSITDVKVVNLSAVKITTGTLTVGGSSAGNPQVSVLDSTNTEVAWMGVRAGISGAWFNSLYIGGSGPATAKIIALNTGAVTIDGATFTLNLNGITTAIDNSLFGGQYTGLRIEDNTTHSKRVQSAYFANSYNASGNPMVVIAGDGSNIRGKILVCNGTGTGGLDGIGSLINLDGNLGRVRVRGDVLIENGTGTDDVILQPGSSGAAGAAAGLFLLVKLGGTDYKVALLNA